MNTKISIGCLAVCLGVACGEDPEPEATGPSGTQGMDSSSGDSVGTTVSPTESADETSSSGGVLPPPEGVLAGGIAIDVVELNQGVGITLADGGLLVPSEGRAAPVIAGRPALVRASYQLAPDFVPRPLIGRLWLRSGSEELVYDDERMVAGPADWTALDGTFHWRVEAAELTDQTEVRVQLLEVDPDAEPVGAVDGAELPAGDYVALEAWGEPMVVELVLVPFTCSGQPDLVLDPVDLADFEAYLYNTMPVQEIVMTVHAPIPSASCSEFDAAETDLPALREAEGAEPWVYYGGLMPGDGGGYSIAVEGGDQMDYRRTFANHAWRSYGLTFDLFAHELGHNHGRSHTFEDPEFPGNTADLCGTIDTYGWGPRPAMMPSSGYGNDLDLGLDWFDPSEELLLPTTRPCAGLPDGNRYNFNDIMSYIYPFWVSAHTYAATAERVRLISSWAAMARPPVPPGRTLRLVIGPEADVHRTSHAGAHAVERADAWASCGRRRLPVRTTRSWLERPRGGGLERFAYVGFELPVPADVDPGSCVLDVEGLRLPFVQP
ncbi:MAG: hypothetical protein KDK70_06060 [Myxococcales bacterium]|nr:hypothetical protein [Myxococcales bacterium]